MSFAEARIREYIESANAVERPLAEVRFAKTRIGDFEIVIAAEDKPVDESSVSEEGIERQLVKDRLIRIPSAKQRTQAEFKRIDVAGKPISELIIEERR